MFTVESIESIYKNQPGVREVDIKWLDSWADGKLSLTQNGCSIDWLFVAAYNNHQRFIDKYMEFYNVPKNLTFKEQMCWLQLLGDSNDA